MTLAKPVPLSLNSYILHGFVQDSTEFDTMAYADGARSYSGEPRDRETVEHSVRE